MKYLEIKNISAAIHHYAKKYPNKTYLIDGEKEYSYSQTNEFLNKICSYYDSLNLKKGDIISAVLENNVDYILLYLATLRYGCVFNPYPFVLGAQDLLKHLKNIHPKIVFCREKHYADLKDKQSAFLIKKNFVDDLSVPYKEFLDFVPSERSPACIYYSSGTTGKPKAIVFSHKNMISNISSIVRGFGFDENTRHLIILPLGHTASINYSFLPVTLCGGTLVLTDQFWKIRARFWEYIKKYEINYIEVVPSILLAILNTRYETEDYKNIETLKYIGCGSATLPKDLQTKFMKKFNLKVANLYGLSETGPTHFDNPLEKGWQPGSGGKPLDVNEIRIVDESDNFLKTGEIGEIIIKGDNVFIDYYNNHTLYETVIRNGYFYTGDLGYIDSENRLFFTGRKKDLIIKGGINVYPDEIDEVLHKMDDIKEVATTGVFHDYLGEQIISFIVLKNDKKLTEEKVIDFCKKYLSLHKVPDQIKFVDSIPKGPSGKILRRELISGVSNEK